MYVERPRFYTLLVLLLFRQGMKIKTHKKFFLLEISESISPKTNIKNIV